MHGKGTLKIEDRSKVYEGELKEGVIHGFGLMRYSDRRIYEGEFKNGLRQGYGYYSWENGNYIY